MNKINIILKNRIFSVLGIIGCSVLLICILCITIVPTGSTGVLSTFGQVHGEPVNGVVLHVPFISKIEKVNNKQQNWVSSSRIMAKNAQGIDCYYDNVEVTYQILPTGSVWIYCNVTDYKSNIITERMISDVIREFSRSQNINTETLDNISIRVQEILQDVCDATYGNDIIKINRVSIDDMEYSEDFKMTVYENIDVKIAAETQEYRNKMSESEAEMNRIRAQEEAEMNRIRAQEEAEMNRIRAQEEADCISIKAEAMAKANQLISESLSEELLEQLTPKSWFLYVPYGISRDSMELNNSDNYEIPELNNRTNNETPRMQ